MNLYIETENGQAKNHPAFEDNLIQAFGYIPNQWEPFVRVPKQSIGVYKILLSETPTYEKINNVWTDVWLTRDMTTEEKIELQQHTINIFNSRPQAANWSAWTLDEVTCQMVPPIPRPELDPTKLEAGIQTYWCGADNNWKDTPPCADDGDYKFDFFAWQWELIVNEA